MPELALQHSGRVVYDDIGDGPVLVCLHGWAMQAGLFAAQRELAGRFRVITPDLRGHGRSTPLPGGQGLALLARDLEALFVHLDLERVILHGWSMGAQVAWHLLGGRCAARVAGLLVEDMSPRITNDAEWQLGLADGYDERTSKRVLADMRADWIAFTDRFVPRIFAPGPTVPPAGLLDVARAAALAADPSSMQALWMSMTAADLRETIRHIALPVLIVHGGSSQLYPAATSRWLESRMPHAQRICFRHSGHAPHLEEPARFNQTITAFAERVETGPPVTPPARSTVDSGQ
jgi:pimeloyl-ACP methyl ester carboxylesterase